MGGFNSVSAKEAKKTIRTAVTKTHKILRDHPMIEFPLIPRDASPREAVDWALHCVAEYLSPKKLLGEDNEFACKDLAKAIRGPLLKELLSNLLP